MMIWAKFVLATQLLAQVAIGATDPATLVDQLGSPLYAEREATARAIEALGAKAIPALQIARNSRDMEVRSRASAMLIRIEGAQLTRPTLVRLDFNDAPLAEVARELTRQTGIQVNFSPPNLPRWNSQRVTLREDEPVHFWRAVDELCGAAQLQYAPEVHGVASRREPGLSLIDGRNRPVTPVSDHGPFRVSLESLHYQREINFTTMLPGFRPDRGNRLGNAQPAPAPNPRNRPKAITSDQFSAQLKVTAEPRLGVFQSGPLQIVEARDDRDNPLLAEGQSSQAVTHYAGYMGGLASPVLMLHVPLLRPEAPGQTIKILRGIVPVRVATRRADPLVVNLHGSAGKNYEKGDIRLTVHEVRSGPNARQTQIELSLVAGGRPAALPAAGNLANQDVFRRVDPQQQNLEVIDARGRILPWFQTSIDAESTRFTITLSGSLEQVDPRELRYYTLTESNAMVPFEFKELPMP